MIVMPTAREPISGEPLEIFVDCKSITVENQSQNTNNPQTQETSTQNE